MKPSTILAQLLMVTPMLVHADVLPNGICSEAEIGQFRCCPTDTRQIVSWNLLVARCRTRTVSTDYGYLSASAAMGVHVHISSMRCAGSCSTAQRTQMASRGTTTSKHSTQTKCKQQLYNQVRFVNSISPSSSTTQTHQQQNRLKFNKHKSRRSNQASNNEGNVDPR